MKRDLLSDCCTVIGATVGVGFLSGKEAQMFFGGYVNVAVFAVCYFAFNLVLRIFCFKKNCGNAAVFSRVCFGKFSSLFLVALCLCNFLCAVAVLAGLQNCLEELICDTKWPVFAFLAAIAAALMLKSGLKVFKIANVLSVASVLVYLLCIAVFTPDADCGVSVNITQPMIYSLFSATTSLAVLAPLSQKNKRNVAAAAVATLIICVLLCTVIFSADFSLNLPVLGKTDNPALVIFGTITVTLAAVTGAAANALPIVQCVNVYIKDTTLSTACVLCAAVLFSVFGFDFAMRYGYLPVALTGAVSVVAALRGIVKDKFAETASERKTKQIKIVTHDETGIKFRPDAKTTRKRLR